MKTKILELFKAYERETEFDGQSINEKMYNALSDDLVKLFSMHFVGLNDMKTEEVFDIICALTSNWYPDHKTVWSSQIYNTLVKFKKEVCKQQREICAEKAKATVEYNYRDESYAVVDSDSILNAPMPE